MRNRVLLTFLLIIVSSICLQGQEKYSIKVSYQMLLNFGSLQENEGVLLCNKNQAFFKFKNVDRRNKEKISVNAQGNLSARIIADTENYIFSENNGYIGELRRDFKEKSFCIVEEVLKPINWKITRETKKIDEYICFKALARFRGRNYTAWFTPQVPVLFGPYKFHGLKGLILEIADETKEVMFRAEKIEYVQLPIQKKDEKIKRVSKEFYKKKIHSFFDDLQRKLTSRGDRNIKIEVKTEIKTIEIEEN